MKIPVTSTIKPSHGILAATIAVASLTMAAPAAATVDFTTLDLLSDCGGSGVAEAKAVSARGNVITGIKCTSSHSYEAFRWTAATGVVGLGVTGEYFSWANDVSADGRTIVGMIAINSRTNAVRWSPHQAPALLGQLPGGDLANFAEGVSEDGSVIVGSLSPLDSTLKQPIRWTASTGVQLLGTLPPGFDSGIAKSVSAKGSVVVGYLARESIFFEAFKWTETTGFEFLGPRGNYPLHDSVATDVSADGTVIVGYGTSASGGEAFRWTAADGMAGLDDIPGGEHSSIAHAVSGNGKIVVGQGQSDAGTEAMLWTACTGMRSIKEFINTEFGFDLGDWQPQIAIDISADGTTIIGSVVNYSLFVSTDFVLRITDPICS